ncbi:MAG: O-antigen ligase family protein, partial [Aquincola sp.]|nr:O-antigen ligase family protein [Aquincola sp.]
MSEHLVALCYILLMSAVSFAVMFKPMTAGLMAVTSFQRRVGLWFAVTVVAFLAHSFWLALLVNALLIAIVARRESNPVALYCLLLFAVPQFTMQIPGLGLVNYLFDIDHPRMLALVLLVPAAVHLLQQARAYNQRLLVADLLFVAYFLYGFLAHTAVDTLTLLMRHVLYMGLDHWLLYYVVTRSVTDRHRFYDVLACFTMAVAAVCLTGVFETLRSWLVYESLRNPLGVPISELTAYLMRVSDDGAYLRSSTTMGHAIVFGYVVMTALCFQLALVGKYAPRFLGIALIALLAGGIGAALSRGPWLGCAVALLIGLSFGPGASRRLVWIAALLPLLIAALLILPQGERIIDLLPFVGTVEAGNVTYRAQLIDRALIVFWQNPIFGSLYFISNPVLEEMRQGQGIIDIVNSYVGVALAYGGIGLLLFIASALWALGHALVTRSRCARSAPDT